LEPTVTRAVGMQSLYLETESDSSLRIIAGRGNERLRGRLLNEGQHIRQNSGVDVVQDFLVKMSIGRRFACVDLRLTWMEVCCSDHSFLYVLYRN
jgi:hypothetical protein